IVASLDQLRAKDLSAHLYNFHYLKRRTESTQEWQGETDPDTDEYVSTSRRRKAWLPVKTWTAWPMDPKAVPRESDESTWEAFPHERLNTEETPISSSELLSDLLTARACKKAKERFHEREWEDSDAELAEPPIDRDSRKQLRIPELAGDTRQFEPVVMADDERAKSILQPSINHVLHKLDTLLMGLHHARSSYAVVHKSSTHSQPATDGDSSAGKKRKKKAATTRESRASSRNRSPSASGEASEVAAESATSFTRLKRGLGLRDWSDVLGVASVSGFPPDVVARTAERCSNLFDESIVFRTLYEGKRSFSEVKYAPYVVPVETLQGFLQSETEQLGSREDSEEEKMAQSTSTTPPKKRTAPDTEAASFLSQFYQTESTERDMKILRSVPETHHKECGGASTSACRRRDAEGQAKDFNERQHPRDMPAVILVEDTGESKTLWSPSEATDRGPHDQDVADLEGKMSVTAVSRTSPAPGQLTDQGKENVPT
ncbi:MAG: hypothetical protein Q9192_004542, partial [Flavoplaca navasiana]